MALDFLFAIRGLLSFVAFTELTNAGRCLLPIPYYADSNINSDLSSGSTYIQVQVFSRSLFQISLDVMNSKKSFAILIILLFFLGKAI